MANLEKICKKIRQQILKTSYEVKACHIGSALSCVEILVVLYWKILKRNDIFIFSKASGASALYSVLAERGYFKKDKLAYYLKNYPLASKEVPGVIHSVGSLGHGLSVAVGMALANKKRRVYCLVSDAEVQEGTFWESLLFASHHKLDNLKVIIDYNKIQACGFTNQILNLESLSLKLQSFNWLVSEIAGHNLDKLEWTLKIPSIKNMPHIIIAHTVKGRGVSFMENDYLWHYRNLDDDKLLELALNNL